MLEDTRYRSSLFNRHEQTIFPCHFLMHSHVFLYAMTHHQGLPRTCPLFSYQPKSAECTSSLGMRPLKSECLPKTILSLPYRLLAAESGPWRARRPANTTLAHRFARLHADGLTKQRHQSPPWSSCRRRSCRKKHIFHEPFLKSPHERALAFALE